MMRLSYSSIIKDYERSFICKSARYLFRRLVFLTERLKFMRFTIYAKVDSTFLDSILIDLTKDYIGAGLYDKAFKL